MPLPLYSASLPVRIVAWASDDPMQEVAADASVGLFEIDLLNREARWSSGLFRLFGFDPVSVGDLDMAEAARERVHPEDAAARGAAFESALAAGSDGRYIADYRVRQPDGAVRWLSVRGRMLPDASRMVGVVTDQTARRLAEIEIAATEQRRDRFLSLLAHDLRNPLAPLHTAAELMRRAEMQPARVVAISDMLSRQVGQMAHLIDDLVDVSRANQGRIELRRQAVDLVALVDQAVDAVRGFVERRRQTIEARFNSTPALFEADPERLMQILTHLLEHASRASTEDSVVRITVASVPGEVRLCVSDDGAGIEADRLAQVFDLYPSAEGDPQRRQTLGTGMALVKALTVLHGGHVDATSAGVGQGATYTIHLPNPA